MKTGNIINSSLENKHLTEPYIELYPDGGVRDFTQINRIPKEHRSYDARFIPDTGRIGQSAILVRKSYYDATRPNVLKLRHDQNNQNQPNETGQ
jgi:hypothetical protein